MKFNEFMGEAIQNRPRNWKLYLANRLKDLNRLIAMGQQARELAKTYDRDGYDILRSALRSGSNDYDTPNDLYLISDTPVVDAYRMEDLRHALESLDQFGPKDFLKYAMNSLDSYTRPVSEEFWATAAKLPYAEKGLIEYGYEESNPEHVADSDYIAAKHLLTACRMNVAAVKGIEVLQVDLRNKLGALYHMQISPHQWEPHKYQPEHGEVETLYHATAFVTEILRDGFSAEKPDERKGVGNFGTQQLISFTHDLEIARTIMRSFKEIWMISHHQLTAETILHWAKAEGILDAVKKSWGNSSGDPLPTGRHADPKKIVILYRYWLAHSKTRSDPMLVNPWEIVDTMADRTLKDIGVLACEVTLTDSDEYKVGESEFRLPASRVQSIKRAM